ECRGHQLMMKPFNECALESVRKRSVSDVVKEDSDTCRLHLLEGDGRAFVLQILQGPLHEPEGSEGMREPRMLRTGEDQKSESQLAYTSETLHVGMVHKPQHRAFGDGDKAVDGVGEGLEEAAA